jgi:DNA methylase
MWMGVGCPILRGKALAVDGEENRRAVSDITATSPTAIFTSARGQGQLYSDSGSAARFYYTAKADDDDRLGSKHPTVKPLDLMQYLCRLVTPPGGTVLDLFAGTGTTGEAAWREGFRAVLRPIMGRFLVGVEPMRRVIVESPYGGLVELNKAYAKACMRDCLERGEAPFASHLLYTQSGILRDDIGEERACGIAAGLEWGACAEATVVYTDLGITEGMMQGVEAAEKAGRPIEDRSLPLWDKIGIAVVVSAGATPMPNQAPKK